MLNIRKKVSYEDSSNEDGLLGLAFHPQFKRNRQFFIYYTTKAHGNVLSRFEISVDDPNPPTRPRRSRFSARLESSPETITAAFVFGPDGYLYIAIGDGGPSTTRTATAKHGMRTGSDSRIDVDHGDPGLNYAIPKDNPFVGLAGARGEMWP